MTFLKNFYRLLTWSLSAQWTMSGVTNTGYLQCNTKRRFDGSAISLLAQEIRKLMCDVNVDEGSLASFHRLLAVTISEHCNPMAGFRGDSDHTRQEETQNQACCCGTTLFVTAGKLRQQRGTDTSSPRADFTCTTFSKKNQCNLGCIFILFSRRYCYSLSVWTQLLGNFELSFLIHLYNTRKDHPASSLGIEGVHNLPDVPNTPQVLHTELKFGDTKG